MIIKHNRCHKEARRAEYPEIGDQLDAIYKLAQSLQSIVDLHPDTLEWINQITAVKDKFKKE